MESLTAADLHKDGTVALHCSSGQPAPVKSRVPTEGECPDADGVPIHILLHVADGFMRELEIYKSDLSCILKSPAARDLVLFTPHEEAGVEWPGEEPKTGGA